MMGTFPPCDYVWNLTPAQYVTKFNDLNNQGYRMIDICVNGDPPNERYAGIWVKESNAPAWQVKHGFKADAFRTLLNDFASQGYTPTCISVTGPVNNAIFAGIWEKTSLQPVPYTVLLDVPAVRLHQYRWAIENGGARIRMLKQYGTYNDVHFALLFYNGQELQKTTIWIAPSKQEIDAYQTAHHQMVFYRPVSVHRILADPNIIGNNVATLFSDVHNGKWQMAFDLGQTSGEADLKSFLANAKSNNMYPISLQRSANQYSVIVTEIWPPVSRAFTATGWTPTELKDVPALLTSLDLCMRKFMQRHSVRHAQIAIGRVVNNATKILLERAYTWSEPERYKAQVADKFLLASVSKAFCCAAVQAVYDGKGIPASRAVTRNTQAYPYLGTAYSNPSAPKLKLITVQQLVDHTAGYDLAMSFDPVFRAREIAQEQSSGTRPTTIMDMVDYMFKRGLDFEPGARYAYSNYGYVLLSAVIEKASGMKYYDYLKTHVLTPLGIASDVVPWTTPWADHKNDNILQDHSILGPSSLEPKSNLYVPNVYGGDNLTKESTVGPSSMAASASTLVKFIGKNAAWGIGGRSQGDRRGSMDGASTLIWSRGDGLDLAVVINTREFWHRNAVDGLFFQDIPNILNQQTI